MLFEPGAINMSFLTEIVSFKMFDKILKRIFLLFQAGIYPTLDKDEQDAIQRKHGTILRLIKLL